MFLNRCGNNADAVSLHWYRSGDYPGWGNLIDSGQAWQANMDYIRSVTTKPIYITEWNALGGSNPGDASKTAGLCLANADIIGAFAKSGVEGHTMFGSIHGVNNSWGLLAGSGDYRTAESVAPAYFVLPLWSKIGDRVLNVSNTANASTNLSVWSHKKADGSVQVMLINKNSISRNVDVNFTGYNPAGRTVAIDEVKASAGGAWDFDIYYNGVFTPQPSTTDLPASMTATASGSTYNRTLPAISVTVLNFSAGAPPPTAFSSSGSAAPVNVVAGAATTISATVTCTSGSLSSGIVDLEIYNSAGTKVGQQYWTGQNFSSGQSQPYTWNWTVPATTGTYTVKIAVFTSGWASLLHWNDNGATIQVVTTAIRLNSGGPASGWFAADANYSGGNTASTTSTISTAAFPIRRRWPFTRPNAGARTLTP